jgi:DNA repair exonuclease SbcCD nuclease subunit
MADTHLGYRTRRGTINKWAIENYSKPYEQEIYDCFLKVMEDISNLKDLDFLVHCGDIFHQPYKDSSYPPPEPARRTLKQGLKLFFDNTNNQVPLIYIEGNHGVFQGFEYTPFESHINKDEFPNLYYYKERDLLNAIKSHKSLSLEFPTKKVRFYLFPFFEFKSFEIYESAYDNWIQNQKPKDNEYINIAVAHGSAGDETLHNKINSDDFNYDYVALGHEHGYKQVSKNHYYSGSLLPMNFKERYENQSYLVVSISEKTKDLTFNKVFTGNLLTRPFEIIGVTANANDSITEIKDKIESEIIEIIGEAGFNYKTAARLKIIIEGEMTFEKNWKLNELMARIRRNLFSQPDKYNVMQFLWKISDISETLEDDISSGLIIDYILDKPDNEFKTFVREKLREDKTEYSIEKLTEFGMVAIKKALKIMEKEDEV